MTKEKLMVCKTGKVVSKARSLASKRLLSKTVGKWSKAVVAARKELGITGFLPVGGKSAQGQALLARARAIYTR